MTEVGTCGVMSATVSAGSMVRESTNAQDLEGLRVADPLTLPNQPRRSGLYLKLGDPTAPPARAASRNAPSPSPDYIDVSLSRW
jgi:hypothetical protein